MPGNRIKAVDLEDDPSSGKQQGNITSRSLRSIMLLDQKMKGLIMSRVWQEMQSRFVIARLRDE